MIFKKTLIISALTIIASSANANVNFDTTFTGDNYVNSFSYNDGTLTQIDTTGLAGTQLWSASSTLNVTLNNVTNYEFIWEVRNQFSDSGFLADFTLGSTTYSTSTDPSIWSYSSDQVNWSSVTGYGQNGAPALSTPWTGLFGGGIATISPNAEWIWDSTNNDAYETLFIKASITSPVPEPSTYALMLGGLGLVGFMAFRRQRKTIS